MVSSGTSSDHEWSRTEAVVVVVNAGGKEGRLSDWKAHYSKETLVVPSLVEAWLRRDGGRGGEGDGPSEVPIKVRLRRKRDEV